MTVAIIGAGMAGAACARALRDRGFEVRLFDKGRSVGGRMAQRRLPAGIFDHGAQYLGAADPEFSAEVTRWRGEGIVAEWPKVASSGGRPVVVGVPAMSAPVRALIGDLSVSYAHRIVGLGRQSGAWLLHGEDRAADGPFSAVVLAIPAPQAVELLRTADQSRVAALILRLGAVRMAPCWSGLAAFADRLPVAGPALRSDEALAWAARNDGKPGRGDGECWTLHAAPDWSSEHLEQTPETIAPALLALFRDAMGSTLPEPTYLAAHRWRYALVERALGEPCVWDPALRLGLCGDWCLGPRVEAAWLSGRAMAAALAKNGHAR